MTGVPLPAGGVPAHAGASRRGQSLHFPRKRRDLARSPVVPTLPALTVLPRLGPLHTYSCPFPCTYVPVRHISLLLLDP